jgi:hypothetical protein
LQFVPFVPHTGEPSVLRQPLQQVDPWVLAQPPELQDYGFFDARAKTVAARIATLSQQARFRIN